MGAFTGLFGTSPRVAVVEAFAENPDDELSVPEIVRIADVSRGAAYTHVRRLLKEGVLVRTERVGKCQYYRFNEEDPRGEAITFLENVLVLGDLERRIKEDEGIPLEQAFPYPRRFDPSLRPERLRVPRPRMEPSDVTVPSIPERVTTPPDYEDVYVATGDVWGKQPRGGIEFQAMTYTPLTPGTFQVTEPMHQAGRTHLGYQPMICAQR